MSLSLARLDYANAKSSVDTFDVKNGVLSRESDPVVTIVPAKDCLGGLRTKCYMRMFGQGYPLKLSSKSSTATYFGIMKNESRYP